MKLPSLIRSNPRAARDKARSELRAVHARLVELADERKVALVDADSIGKVAAIDTQLAAHAVTVRALQDRIRALAGECRRVELERLEQARTAAIDSTIVPQLSRFEALGADLEQAVVDMAAAYAVLETVRRELYAKWPPEVPRPAYHAHLSLDDLRTRIVGAMRIAANSGDPGRLAELANSFDGRKDTIAESIKRRVASFLEALRAVPIEIAADDDDDDDPTTGDIENHAGARALTGFAAMAT
jgi:hypothetical protein